MPLRATLSKVISQSPFLSFLNHGKGQLLFRLGLSRHHSGATHYGLRLEQSIAYIDEVVAGYLQYGLADGETIAGKDILEVGPGDSLGVALRLYAMGANSVVCLDGFAPEINRAKCTAIYRALLERMPLEERTRAENAIQSQTDTETIFHERCIRYLTSLPIEGAGKILPPRSFDLILSRAVLEHVGDYPRAWSSMIQLLRPDGAMWHKIDMRNHRLFEGIHPLYFLTIAEPLWRVVSSPDPTLNRFLAPAILALSNSTFRHTASLITHVVGSDEFRPHKESLTTGIDYGQKQLDLVRGIRASLQPQFRGLADTELMITGLFLVSRGPVHPA